VIQKDFFFLGSGFSLVIIGSPVRVPSKMVSPANYVYMVSV